MEKQKSELELYYEAGLRGEFPPAILEMGLIMEPHPTSEGIGGPSPTTRDLHQRKEVFIENLDTYFQKLELEIHEVVQKRRKFALVEEEILTRNRQEEQQYRILQKKIEIYNNEMLGNHEAVTATKDNMSRFEELVIRMKQLSEKSEIPEESIPPLPPSEKAEPGIQNDINSIMGQSGGGLEISSDENVESS